LKTELKYADKIVMLDNGVMLIARLILDSNNDNENFIFMMNPMDIVEDLETGDLFFKTWIPASKDKLFTIPVVKILNISEPSDAVLDSYQLGYYDTKPKEEEQTENEEQTSIPTPNDVTFH
jgi:hypothetical protein